MWRWTLETERSRETAVTWVAVAAWRQAVVSTGACPGLRAAGCSVLSEGALAWVVVAASRSANVLEDRGDDIGIFDAGDDAQFTAALGAGLDVDGDDAFQAPHPGHGGKGLIRLFAARFAFWHDRPAMLAIRREHAVEPGEVQSRTRDQRRRAGDEVEWVEDDAGGAVAKRLLEPIDDLCPIVGREPLVGDGGRRDVATELFELVALGGFTDGGGVERKARLRGEQGGWEGFGPYRDGARGQCLPVGVGPDGDPVVDRGQQSRRMTNPPYTRFDNSSPSTELLA